MKKKCALITGASGGIGSSIALRLARDGFAVAACYRSDEAGIASLAAELDVIGAEYKIYRADVADYSQMNTVFADATEEFGGVSVLVNNAGVAQQKLFTDITEDQITSLLINTTERAADDTIGLTSVISAFAIEVLSGAHAPSAYVTGENRLLNQPEYRDPDKAHKLMGYLSGGGYILPPEEELGDDVGIKVLIGPENVAEELKDSSVVIASYDAGDNLSLIHI